MDLNISGLEDVVEVGRGGFATVYRAYQPAFRRTVAIKVLNAADVGELSAERFRRECQAMGLLSEHPSIVTILDAGFLDTGQPYMVMPFMPAGSFQDRVRSDGPLPWAEASRVAVKLAGALHAAHDAGVIHRDVKPANVLISEYGEAKLADFGIARVSGASETQSGVVTASLAYAPPEVVEGKRPTVRSDVYSLGATIYDLVAGHAPFAVGEDTSVAAILNRILNQEPPDLVSRGVPAPVAEVIAEAMAKDPAGRPDTAALFGRRMRLAQDELGIRPTELMIAKIEHQPPKTATDAEPEAATEAGTHQEEEPETVGVTAPGPMTVSVIADHSDGLNDDGDTEQTRPVPGGAEPAIQSPAPAAAASPQQTDVGVGDALKPRARPLGAVLVLTGAMAIFASVFLGWFDISTESRTGWDVELRFVFSGDLESGPTVSVGLALTLVAIVAGVGGVIGAGRLSRFVGAFGSIGLSAAFLLRVNDSLPNGSDLTEIVGLGPWLAAAGGVVLLGSSWVGTGPGQRRLDAWFAALLALGLIGLAAWVVIDDGPADTAGPSVADDESSDGQPPEETTATITTTTTAPTTATSPAEPTPLPLEPLPDVVGSFVTGVEIVDYDDLSRLSGVVTVDGELGRTEDGLRITGFEPDGGSAAFVHGSPGDLSEGDAIVFRFSYEPDTSLVFVLENHTTFATPGYHRFGFRMGAEWQPDTVLSEHWDGEAEITGFAPVGDLLLTPGAEDTQYVALIALAEGGRFVLGVWQDAATLTRVVDEREFGEGWQEGFGFYLAVESGTLTLHEHWRIEFDGVG